MAPETREHSITPDEGGQGERSRSARGQSVWLALGVWIVASAAALAVFVRMDERVERVALADEARRASALAASVAQVLVVPIELLRGLSGLLATFPSLGAQPFRDYADHVASEQPAVTGMHLRSLVSAAGRADFERVQGFAITDARGDGRSHPAAARPLYLPVVLRADWEDRGTLGEDLLGSDAASNVERTLRDGAPAVYVRRGANARADELCLLEGAEPLLGGADTRRAFAELCVDLDLLIRRGVPGGFGGPSLSLRIFDLSSPAGQHLIYGQTRAGDAPAESAWHEAALAQHDLRLGGRLWRVMVTRAALGLDRSEPLSVLVAGLVVATLLAGSTFALSAAAQLRRRLSRFERLGQYVLEEKLGSGGMGTVYRARHNLLRRPTAVKVIPASLQNDGALLRFEREVRITASLSHPNTVAVYDFGRIRGGGFYYAMEYLEGLDLQRLVECHGPQSEARVVHILVQAAGALAEAHERGVIHRDVKPANLMLCTRGGIPDFVKVLDFGLVKDLCHRDELERRDFVGTPLYASPEASLAPDAMDARSDLYALGAVAFFLLTGREVFRGPRVIDVLSQHVSTPVPSFSEVGTQGVSRALEALVRSCLAKTPAHRPPSATGLRRSLEGIARLRPWSDADARRWWAEHAGRSADSVRAEPVSREQIALQNTQVEVHRVMRRAPP